MRRRLLSGDVDYSSEYFTIVALSDNTTIYYKISSNLTAAKKNIRISNDNGNTWETKSPSTNSGTTLGTLNQGQKILVKGDSQPFYYKSGYITYSHSFIGSNPFKIEGNIMSLIYEDSFNDKVTLINEYEFYKLFSGSTNLSNIDNLILPATTLTKYCYEEMFYGCTSLTALPNDLLPATSLSNSCYYGMFHGCASLTALPNDLLPATTLTVSCYEEMFYGCTSLTALPNDLLPGDPTSYCYSHMFQGCTSLTAIPQGFLPLPSNTNTWGIYYGMFQSCTNLRNTPKDLLPAMKIGQTWYCDMFWGCTSLITAPDLPATELYNNCYNRMFYSCTSLVEAPDMADAL